MNRMIDVVAFHRRTVILGCLVLAATILGGCLSTWEFSLTDRTMKIVKVGPCSTFLKADYQMDPGDTVTFLNHAGKDVVVVFPAGTVTAQDEDTLTSEIEVSVKAGRRKRVTIADDPPLTPAGDDKECIELYIEDPCHGGAKMIIPPAHS